MRKQTIFRNETGDEVLAIPSLYDVPSSRLVSLQHQGGDSTCLWQVKRVLPDIITTRSITRIIILTTEYSWLVA